ncbi:MAG: dihydroneopterin aldolase [Acidimicrobiales bacterium]|nr:dihydroneopterin aldolase [Acidimicrobiales bacterium]
MLNDRIELRGLTMLALCGLLPEELKRRQPLSFDLDVYLDLTAASLSDDLHDTVNYGALCELVESIIKDERFDLLERCAGRVAEKILEFEQVKEVTVTVHKLRPPVPQDLATSGVRIHRPL